MNRIYKVIWSKVKNQYVVVSELAHSNGKQSSKSEKKAAHNSLRALAAALIVSSSLLAVLYTASAADSYQLQNGEDVITVDGNNLNDFFMEAVQNEDGSYTIIFEDGTSAAVAEENLYNVGDRLGAFVTTNEDGTKAVYTDDVLDKNSTKVVPAKNHVVTNEEGFYVNNGKGTYNTLNKDGLWVGGTNDEEGLHVDSEGNIETTGSANINKGITTGNVNINTDGQNTVTGLSNTEWKPAEAVANRAATEGQLKTVSDEAAKHTTVQSGKNVTIQQNQTADGHLDYTVNLNDDVTLNNITANKVDTTNLEAGKADIEGIMTAGRAVIEGGATVGGGLTAGSVTTEGKLTAGSADISGNTNITGIATVGGLNTEGNVTAYNITAENELKAEKADIDGTLTAGTAHVEGNATVNGTLDANNVTADEGTIGGVGLDNSTVTADDVNTSNLTADNMNTTNLTAGKADIKGTMTVGSAVVENGATVKGGLTAGNVTTTGNVQAYNINADNNLTAGKAVIAGVVQGGSFANTNESFKVDGSGNVTANSVTGLTNKTLNVEGFATVGRAATEEQLKLVSEKADTATTEAGKHTTVVNGNNIDITEGTNAAGGKEYTISATGLADTDLSNITTTGENKITNLAKGSDQHIKAQEYTVADDGTVTMTYVDGNGNSIAGQTAKIKGLATDTAVKAAKTEVIAGTNIASIGTAEGNNGQTVYTVNAKDTTVSGDNNFIITPNENTQTNVTDYAIALKDIVTIGSVGGTNKPITIDGTKGEITGLTNTGWSGKDEDIVNNRAATEGQLKTVYQEALNNAKGTQYTAGNGLNSLNGGTEFSVKEGQGITVDSSGVAVKAGNGIAVDDKGVNINLTADEKNLVLEGDVDGQKTLGLADELTGLTSVTATAINGTTGNFTTSITVGSSDTGIVIGDNKISGLSTEKIKNGDGTYAVNKDYVDDKIDSLQINGKEYKAGSGLSRGGTDQDTFSVNTGNGIKIDNNAVTVNNGNGLEFADGTEGQKQLQVNANEEKGIEVTADGVGIKLSSDSNLTVDENGLSLAKELSGLTSIGTGSLTASGDVSAANFKIGDKTYISRAGINANEQKITNVEDGSVALGSKDAVNGGQLYTVKQSIKTYTAGDGISIDEGNNNTISVNKGNGLTFVDGTDGKQLQVMANTAKGITVDESGVAVNAGDGLTFDETEGAATKGQLKVNTGAGLSIDRENGNNAVRVNVGNGIEIDSSNNVGVKLSLNNNIDDSNLTFGANGGLKLKDSLTGLTSVSSKGVVVGSDYSDPMHIEQGITINGQKITGLDTDSITLAEDAVNKAYVDQFFDSTKEGLAVQYDKTDKTTVTLEGADGTEIKGLADARWEDGSDSAASVNLVYDKVGAVQWRNANYLDNDMDLTEATTALDTAIGTNRYTGGNVLDPNTDGKSYTSITQAVDRLNTAIGPMLFGSSNFLQNQTTVSGALDKLDANLSVALNGIGVQTNEEGDKITTTINWERHFPGGTTVVSAINSLEGRVDVLEENADINTESLAKTARTFSAMSAPQISTLSALSNMDMSAVNALSTLSADNLATISTLSTEDTPVSNADPATNDSLRQPDPDTLEGDHIIDGELSVRDNATFDKDVSVGGKFDVTGEANFHSNATFDKDVSIGGTLNMNGNKITGVADGEVSATSTDAINGSQLYAVEQRVDNNSQAINAVGNQVNRLSNRIDKVGAGAAALAALHPLDFDPDDKLSFAAGYGNYAGENAVAVGAFYQPNEDTMFSIGGTFGNDENMVNAGVSFKLGQKSNVSRSRVSMAKELVALRDEVAQLKALMAHSGVLPQGKLDTSALFPDVPENHWAYEYVHELGKLGILEGTESGNYEGDRMMTRYEMAAIVYRAMQKGVNVDSRMLNEFAPELKLIRVDVVARDDNGNPTIERVRVNDTQQA